MASFTSSAHAVAVSPAVPTMSPVPIPNPQIFQCVVRPMRVLSSSDNRIVEKTCLVSQSGRYYEIGRFIRETIFGHVSHALALTRSHGDILVQSDPPVHIAIKIYFKTKLRELQGNTQENPFKEMAAMQFVRDAGGHTNVIQHIECCADTDRVFSIMEFIDGGELYDIVETSSSLDERLARFYFRQIVNGLRFLHSLPISHRDMSLENVLVSQSGVCKIIDLGMCLRVGIANNGTGAPMPCQGPCGKRNYIAPEVFENVTPFQPMLADIWALGVMLFILVTGVPPMDAAIQVDPRFRMICNGHLSVLLEQWGIILSSQVVDLIASILKPHPYDRPSLDTIMAHEWMQLDDMPLSAADEDALMLEVGVHRGDSQG